MPRFEYAWLCAALALVMLMGAALVTPRVLAASATVQVDAPLLDAPYEGAATIGSLAASAVVSVDGPPVDGFYPVTVDGVSGWIRGDAIVLDGGADVGSSGDALPAQDTRPATTEATPGATGTELGGDPAAAPAGSAPAPVDPANPEPAPDSGGAPALAPNAPTVAVPDAGPVGPAAVMADAPILAGPGSEFGVLGMALSGSMVEQTGHQIDGYVTVRYVEVTGWVALDLLTPPLLVEEPGHGDSATG